MKKGLIFVFAIAVFFFAFASANVFDVFDNHLYVCENSALNYQFNLTENFGKNFSFDIQPKNIFFVREANINDRGMELFSSILNKNGVGKEYNENVFVSFNGRVYNEPFVISAIEINNPPVVGSFDVVTLETSKNSVYSGKIVANDVEDGNLDAGALKTSLTFVSGKQFFDVSNGVIDVQPTKDNIGNYNVLVCVDDKGIKNPDKKIGLCGQTGESAETCVPLYISVVDKNHEPSVARANNASFVNTRSNEMLQVRAIGNDADDGALDYSWFVDGVFVEKNSSLKDSSFEYTFDCKSLGTHTISVIVSDGLANTSTSWNVSVENKGCGIVQKNVCDEMIACDDWSTCQNAMQSFSTGTLKKNDYATINATCAEKKFGSDVCGFQLRNCVDTNACNSPTIHDSLRECYFTANPSCSDGMKNCHDGNCEFLPDCGGPCKLCASCSDGIKNGNEEGVDCGGACGVVCSSKKSFMISALNVKYLLLVVVIVLLIIAIVRFVRVYNREVEFTRMEKKRKAENDLW